MSAIRRARTQKNQNQEKSTELHRGGTVAEKSRGRNTKHKRPTTGPSRCGNTLRSWHAVGTTRTTTPLLRRPDYDWSNETKTETERTSRRTDAFERERGPVSKSNL
ncbi:hypothetical protein GWI33_003096 [Rhynchophorus ferrugineus]|uniref:Uncharacterized protein n=1 Tax=Rhynchophorus ferrugineus TaxID=354439 RepID=A0A834INB7_RHYFE|nr:hypothetical protein GWI33_003096 [Rhynchophorus ferrugineus]